MHGNDPTGTYHFSRGMRPEEEKRWKENWKKELEDREKMWQEKQAAEESERVRQRDEYEKQQREILAREKEEFISDYQSYKKGDYKKSMGWYERQQFEERMENMKRRHSDWLPPEKKKWWKFGK